MKLNENQFKSLVSEANEWRSQEAQNRLKELREEVTHPLLLDEVVKAYSKLAKEGGWRASREVLSEYENSVKKFMKIY